jgi:hypothetical protein
MIWFPKKQAFRESVIKGAGDGQRTFKSTRSAAQESTLTARPSGPPAASKFQRLADWRPFLARIAVDRDDLTATNILRGPQAKSCRPTFLPAP